MMTGMRRKRQPSNARIAAPDLAFSVADLVLYPFGRQGGGDHCTNEVMKYESRGFTLAANPLDRVAPFAGMVALAIPAGATAVVCRSTARNDHREQHEELERNR